MKLEDSRWQERQTVCGRRDDGCRLGGESCERSSGDVRVWGLTCCKWRWNLVLSVSLWLLSSEALNGLLKQYSNCIQDNMIQSAVWAFGSHYFGGPLDLVIAQFKDWLSLWGVSAFILFFPFSVSFRAEFSTCSCLKRHPLIRTCVQSQQSCSKQFELPEFILDVQFFPPSFKTSYSHIPFSLFPCAHSSPYAALGAPRRQNVECACKS